MIRHIMDQFAKLAEVYTTEIILQAIKVYIHKVYYESPWVNSET